MTLYFLKLQNKVGTKEKTMETENGLYMLTTFFSIHLCQCCLSTNLGKLYSYYFTILSSFR